MDSAIVVDQLAKTYTRSRRPPVEALRPISFAVRRGEVFGLLGPNGAGKTTILKCLLSIVRPTAGGATVLGDPLGAEGYRRKIGYLPEGHQFPPYLTAAQILDYTGAMRGTPKAERRARIPELLERVGMTSHADKKVREFSKGMKQRTGLAAALINNPEILFLDEPTDGVDPVGRRDIREMIRELGRKQGLTVVLNSHMLSEVEMVADRVAILDRGELKKLGAVSEILQVSQGGRQNYRLQFAPPADGQPIKFGPVEQIGGGVLPAEGGLMVQGVTVVELNALLDSLRAQGVLIAAVLPERATLEDVFMQLIGAGAESNGGPNGLGSPAATGWSESSGGGAR